MFLKEEKNKRNKVFPPGRLLSFLFVLVGLRKQDQSQQETYVSVSLSRWTRGHAGSLGGGVYLVGSSLVEKGPLRLTVFLLSSAAP